MKQLRSSTRKERRILEGMTINLGIPHTVALEHTVQHVQERADAIGDEIHVTDGFTGEELALVRPRRKSAGISVSLAGLKEDDYERVFKHTNFKGNKVQ